MVVLMIEGNELVEHLARRVLAPLDVLVVRRHKLVELLTGGIRASSGVPVILADFLTEEFASHIVADH